MHLGLGAFARAHIAAYTDGAIAVAGGDWRITGVSLRGEDVANTLNVQDGRYTLIERGETPTARVVASIAGVIAGNDLSKRVLEAISNPTCRIVSITVTEKGYGLLRSGGCDVSHPAVAADLLNPSSPRGALGLIAQGLALRFANGLAPCAVLCCDNLPENGALLRAAVIDFARHAHGSALAERIAAEVSFPSTMVDRITPAATTRTRADAAALTGYEDQAAIETEPFSQWVIEDYFPSGRPSWQDAGAIFVPDVAPYEKMKLRMLNGSHSMLAYAGFLSGKTYVCDVMADADLSRLVRRHMEAAAATLPTVAMDLAAYATSLCERFSNPAIAHETRQIAMDGTQKLPQRIFAPAFEMLQRGGDLAPFAFTTAAWMRYALGRNDAGQSYPLNDPREGEIQAALASITTESPATVFSALAAIPDFLPEQLAQGEFAEATIGRLERILGLGMVKAIAAETE
ncbi:mannitol dehydrogenase family protein [Sinorhizobium sp. RAC02]|uniref:mannitol dehydrogenase family protein n=1 Tax=Sinorhizobium sp. RAC02 TaxID=1842534 RepID=UPI000AC44249|nr:mannitol dehydrogenase family protein [Sinorhizobium sp. RAC02]